MTGTAGSGILVRLATKNGPIIESTCYAPLSECGASGVSRITTP
jgi:hypothetical protein